MVPLIALAMAGLFLPSDTHGVAPDTLDHALVVVLDASGSMKEAVESGQKTELARMGLLATLDRLAPSTAVSLRLLGAGPGDECEATTQLIPMAPFDQGTWEGAIASIPWDGTTPLGHSISAALVDLEGSGAARREILLIGDGEEMCGQDPVAVARAQSNGIRIHTLSLGERDSPQLAGIALVTGGTYRKAINEESFEEASSEMLPDLPPAPQEAAGAPGGGGRETVEIILDVSNSMWGRIGGETKMDLAKSALRELLAGFPPDVPVGLRAYGHRVEADDRVAGCRDTELLVPAAPGASAEVLASVEGLTPMGRTPIARSLREAAQDVAEIGPSVLILLSDGVESCEGDPVQTADSLRNSGLPVVLHTVGLGVDGEAAAQLGAIAESGGGSYFDAPSPEDLLSGMQTAVESSSEFFLDEEELPSFPAPVNRVAGGDSVQVAQQLGDGFFSLENHLRRDDWRYFQVATRPGATVRVKTLVCALAVTPQDDGTWLAGTQPSRAYYQALDASGERLRGRQHFIDARGDMGEWYEMNLTADEAGLVRFRVGAQHGRVSRDILFQVEIDP